MKLLREILQQSTDYLQKRHILKPRLSAELLLSHLLQIKRLDLYLQFDRPMEERELSCYRALLKRRALGEPLEYILGKIEFYHCTIELNRDVLIPRPETEILLSLVCKQITDPNRKIALDLCTGSGCLAIGLKKHFPGLTVIGSDLSAKALEVARTNAANNQVHIDFVESDLLQGISQNSFHYVLCNPPYLALEEYEILHREVRDFEPAQALIAGKTGLEFFERLSEELPSYLEESAQLFFEIGSSQERILTQIFQHSHWKNVQIKRDWAGHPRFFFCEYNRS